MKQQEKNATIDYLEFGLVELVKTIEGHVHEDAVAGLYKDAYALLNDMDETMQVSVDSVATTPNKAKE